ncbi:MAG: TonB-dependent receptor [Rhodoferax sp.]|uniref:TonB-dependent receptor plug domain-containing protein n=1 Tax=Rhodoferax sp. TaxID=50421 RepID=UPI001838AA7F|nr:TonB-dependent receptor [Rhodoferax sp.]NMM15219.1 TonB-dependent receptor [Rhodoferax sp.]NMM19704.1 TonB-dependent receptor [Rhodoferax sp.]
MNYSFRLIALLGWTSLAAAQTPESVSEKDFLGDMPIVLSVSRLPQRLDETPGAVTILDRNMIRLSGARDVADLLRLVPGFQTSTSFESGAPLASYHGGFDAFSARMQVLVDGRSVYSPYFLGGTGRGLQTVALADIERIEVLRGSNSAAYGARAMLGVVNIVTRHTQDTLGLQAALTSGENGINDSQARIGWGKEDASYRLTVDRRADAGLTGSNGHNQISRVNFRADLRGPANDDIQLRAGGLEIESGNGYSYKVADPLRDRTFGSGYAQLDWRRSLGEDEDLAFSLSHTEESYRDTFPYSLIELKKFVPTINDSLDIEYSGQSSSDTVSLQHTFRHGSNLRVVWGGELRREQVISKPLYNTDAAFVTEFSRLFANAEWRLARDLVLNAGSMFEHSSVSGDSLAPRLMLNWHVAEGQTLRAGVSQANRPPSTFEKFSNVRYASNGVVLQVATLSRGNVQPESVLTQEIGYLGDFPKLGASLDVRAFHEQISGFVRSQPYALPPGTALLSKVAADFINTEDLAIHGVEYQLKWRPWRDGQFIFNQAYIDIESLDRDTSWGAPKLASSLTFFQKLPGNLDLSLMHQDNSTASPQGSTGDPVAMTRTDLRLGLPLRFGTNRGELALVVQNLGTPYPDFDKSFQFQRRAFVTLRVEN